MGEWRDCTGCSLEISQHPADRLIRNLISTGREATPEEIGQVIERMASAPFDRRDLPVPPPLRGLRYQDRELGARADALFRHLVQRVVDEGQWAVGTNAAQYVGDLRQAVRHPASRLAVYERRGGNVAAVFASNEVPNDRRGHNAEAHIFVVYSADRGRIVSGYQVSNLDRVSIPEDTRWLK